MGQIMRCGAALATAMILGVSSGAAGSATGGSVGESAVPPNGDAARGPGQPAMLLEFDAGRAQPGTELRAFGSTGTAKVAVRSVTRGDGAVVRRKGYPQGFAVRLPKYDPTHPGHAVVRVLNDGKRDPFNPRLRGFTFGADFALNARSGTVADDGDNLVQRGLFGAAGQYKIQLDRRQATCRVKGKRGEATAVSPTRVEAGRWYRVRCTRRAGTVTLQLGRIRPDGTVDYAAPVSNSAPFGQVAFERRIPLSVGGKLRRDGRITPEADQFNGSVDRVFYRLLG